jgi:uncharacterized protein involved in exopolysaccharide biosynthesis
MTKPPENKSVVRSQRIFERLLKAYPRRHREEYGVAMAQLFRDQCRDAWGEAGGWGLVKLWLRVLPDLVKTSVSEHLANLKEKGSIMKRLSTMLRAVSSSWVVFAMVFALVFVTVLGTSALVTFLQPNIYSSAARIKIRANSSDSYDPYFIQTEFAVMQSELILDKVIEKLGLNTVWAKKFSVHGDLKTAETRELLRHMIEIRPIRGGSLIAIRAYGEKPEEAAKLANTLAEVYSGHRMSEQRNAMAEDALRTGVVPSSKFIPAEIIDSAEPNTRAVRPNVPWNIFLGGVVGTLAALVVGGLAVWIATVAKRGRTAPAR